MFFLNLEKKRLNAEEKTSNDKNKIAFGAVKRLKIPIEPTDPIAAPVRSEAYNLKLCSAYNLNNCEYTIPAKKNGRKRSKK